MHRDKRYNSYDPTRSCPRFWYRLDNLDGQPFDPSGKTRNFLVTEPADCFWGEGGVRSRDSLSRDYRIDNEASPFWIVQYKSINEARILYHDEARFLHIIRPKGSKPTDYPVLAYGGLSLNKTPWFQEFLRNSDENYFESQIENTGKIVDFNAAVFFSYYDFKKKRFVEGGSNYYLIGESLVLMD